MGVTYLLDTHVLLWLLGEPRRVPAPLAEELADPDIRLWVSAASAMEVATKLRIGKLPQAQGLVARWLDHIDDLDADELPITPRHALLAGTLAWDHRDPFDRLLAAQAILENVPLITSDAAFAGLPEVRVRW